MSEPTVTMDTPVPEGSMESRPRRLGKVGAWIAGLAVLFLVLQLLGVDVSGWLSSLWDQIRAIPPGSSGSVSEISSTRWPSESSWRSSA